MRSIEENNIISTAHFEQTTTEPQLRTIYGVARAAYTLLNVPQHDSSYFHGVARELASVPQPVHQPLEDEITALHEGPATLIDYDQQPELSSRLLLGNFGLLMQFSQYLPQLEAYGRTPYAHVSALREEIVVRGGSEPLGYADQLTVALEQTDGNLPEALWRLLVTSRLYARWFDSGMIDDIPPELTKVDIMRDMEEFARAVAACKSYDPNAAQDVAGDTYYTWTHALGGVLWNALPKKQTVGTKLGSIAIHNGTSFMHQLAHRIKAQTIVSDHTIAAEYGNAIGDALSQLLNSGGASARRLT